MEAIWGNTGFKMASHSLAVSEQEDDDVFPHRSSHSSLVVSEQEDDDVFPHRSSHSSLVTVLGLIML